MARRRSTKGRGNFEPRLIAELDEDGVAYGYETETFPWVEYHKYTPDFVFYNTRIIVEAKGYFKPKDRTILLNVRDTIRDEGWDIRLVFQRASNKIHRLSKTTYADWCDRHGFVWADGSIPKEWYSE